MHSSSGIITRAQFEQQLAVVDREIGSRHIDKHVVLAIGGLLTAELFRAPTAAIPTYEQGGNYYMGNLVRLCLDVLAGQVVLISDEGSNRGRLLVDVARSIKPPQDDSRLYGQDALTCAFMARKDKLESGDMPILPDIFGELCIGKPPKPYLEFEHLRRISVVREIAQQIEPLDNPDRHALIAVGNCFTAAAELAKRLGINGRYVGGLPADENGVPDMSWAQVGDCEGRKVLVLGAAGVHLDTVVQAVGETGTPQPYTLPVL